MILSCSLLLVDRQAFSEPTTTSSSTQSLGQALRVSLGKPGAYLSESYRLYGYHGWGRAVGGPAGPRDSATTPMGQSWPHRQRAARPAVGGRASAPWATSVNATLGASPHQSGRTPSELAGRKNPGYATRDRGNGADTPLPTGVG